MTTQAQIDYALMAGYAYRTRSAVGSGLALRQMSKQKNELGSNSN